MAGARRHWLLNLLIVVSVILCVLAFAVHSRTWQRAHEDRLQLLTGLYFLEVPFSAVDSLSWKEQLPQLERNHGFSYWAREKGRFKDSLYPARPIYIFVDDLRQPKLKISYRDSLTLFLNFSDSLETRALYDLLVRKMEPTESGPE
jgi:hypothetical protein